RRLRQLYRQPLPKRAVKHGVAGPVDEIGEDNRVLVGEFRRPVKIEIACDEYSQRSHGGRFPPSYWGVPFQALQVGADFRSVLVAQLGVLFQAVLQDAPQLRRCLRDRVLDAQLSQAEVE